PDSAAVTTKPSATTTSNVMRWDVGLPLLVSAYLISLALRVAQGSATVAITTTAGLLGPAVMAAEASPAQLALLIVAMGAGAFFASHANDPRVWPVGGRLQVDGRRLPLPGSTARCRSCRRQLDQRLDRGVV